MSGDQDNQSHPARKLDLEELKEYLAESKEDLPAVTRRITAQEFSEVKPKTVGNNLDDLAENNEICRFNDGDVVLYWYPRENDEAGEVEFHELVDDSVEYDEIDPTEVPVDLAEEIAEKRLPYYRRRSIYSKFTGFAQTGIMISLGLIVLGIGELVSSSLGLEESTASLVLQVGFILSLVSVVVFVASTTLDLLASRGHISRDPYPWLRNILG